MSKENLGKTEVDLFQYKGKYFLENPAPKREISGYSMSDDGGIVAVIKAPRHIISTMMAVLAIILSVVGLLYSIRVFKPVDVVIKCSDIVIITEGKSVFSIYSDLNNSSDIIVRVKNNDDIELFKFYVGIGETVKECSNILCDFDAGEYDGYYEITVPSRPYLISKKYPIKLIVEG